MQCTFSGEKWTLLDSALDSSWLLFIFPMLWCFCFSFLFFTTVYFSILQISPSIFPMLWCLRRTRRRNLTYLVRLIIFFCWLTVNSFDLANFLKRCHLYWCVLNSPTNNPKHLQCDRGNWYWTKFKSNKRKLIPNQLS